MEIRSIGGLPAHPLFVHAVVVLLPLAVVITLLALLVPRLGAAWRTVAVGLALAATVSVVLAQGAGEELEHEVERTPAVREHASQGERVLPWVIGLDVVAVASLVAGRRRRPLPRAAAVALPVVAALVAVGAVYFVIDVGHSGARATWEDVLEDGG